MISLIFSFSLISYSIFSYEFEKSNTLFSKRISQKFNYYFIESYIDLAPYYEKISSIKSIKSFLPYSYFYDNNTLINAIDFDLLMENRINIACGYVSREFDFREQAIVGFNILKDKKIEPCSLIGNYLNVNGEKFKIVAVFKKTKNRFFDLNDDGVVISFKNYRTKNINNSSFFNFILKVDYNKFVFFKAELSKIISNFNLNLPRCFISLNEIKTRKESFYFLKTKILYFSLIISLMLGSTAAYLNKKFFLLLKIIGYNFIQLVITNFSFSFLIFLFLFILVFYIL